MQNLYRGFVCAALMSSAAAADGTIYLSGSNGGSCDIGSSSSASITVNMTDGNWQYPSTVNVTCSSTNGYYLTLSSANGGYMMGTSTIGYYVTFDGYGGSVQLTSATAGSTVNSGTAVTDDDIGFAYYLASTDSQVGSWSDTISVTVTAN